MCDGSCSKTLNDPPTTPPHTHSKCNKWPKLPAQAAFALLARLVHQLQAAAHSLGPLLEAKAALTVQCLPVDPSGGAAHAAWRSWLKQSTRTLLAWRRHAR